MKYPSPILLGILGLCARAQCLLPPKTNFAGHYPRCPARIEARAGAFRLRPGTRHCGWDSASRETGEFLAQRLRQATGYKFPSAASDQTPAGQNAPSCWPPAASLLAAAREAYQLTVAAGFHRPSRLQPDRTVFGGAIPAATPAAGKPWRTSPPRERTWKHSVRANRGPSPLRLARLHAGRFSPPFLHQGGSQTVSRPDGPCTSSTRFIGTWVGLSGRLAHPRSRNTRA